MNIENENKGNRSFRKQYLAHSFALKTQNYGRFQLLTHNRRERSARLSCRKHPMQAVLYKTNKPKS